MDFPDEAAPVYVPDFETGSLSDDTMFDTESSSDFSMSTITSSEITGYFRTMHGFLFSVDENNPSVYPAHPTNNQVETLHHTIFRLSQDGQNVPPEAARVLRSCQETGGARVLELMTNMGIWVQEMAEEYTTATFLSIDSKPLVPHKPHPRITFEMYDVYAGIAEPDETFDIVQATGCVTETKNFNFLLREMHRVLKPNGMLLLAEMPFQAFDAEYPLEPLRSAPNRAECLRLIRRALELQGIDLSIWDDMSDRLSPSHPLWSERTIDPVVGLIEPPNTSGSIRGFHSIMQHTRLIPIGPWPDDEAQRMLGLLMRLLVTNLWTIMVPLLCTTGIDEASAQSMVDKALQEFKNNQVKGYSKSYHWSAQKIPL